MTDYWASRLFAAGIAAAAWVGLAVQFAWLYREYSALMSLWIMSGYFTILTNVLVAVVFSCLALDRTALRSGSVVAGTMLSIVLVGVVNALLLWGLLELSGGSALVDKLLHVVTPLCALLFWILVTPKGSLRWRDPLVWAVYPLAYLAFALARGGSTGRYAYPFLNVSVLGWGRIALNAFLIAAGFMLCGFATVWLDHRMSSRSRYSPARIR